MKRLSLAVLLALVSLSAFAVEPPKQQLYVLFEDVLNPSMIAQYEGATKDLFGAFGEKKMTSPSFGVNTYMTADMHYMYMTPLANWAQLDTIDKDWMGASEVIGKDRWADIHKRRNPAILSYDEVVVARRDDLSYMPENPRLPRESEPFARLDYYYLRPGTEAQAEQVAKDYVALFKETKTQDG